jgi:hypothetical protein
MTFNKYVTFLFKEKFCLYKRIGENFINMRFRQEKKKILANICRENNIILIVKNYKR